MRERACPPNTSPDWTISFCLSFDTSSLPCRVSNRRRTPAYEAVVGQALRPVPMHCGPLASFFCFPQRYPWRTIIRMEYMYT